jgi:hypothetical protein
MVHHDIMVISPSNNDDLVGVFWDISVMGI